MSSPTRGRKSPKQKSRGSTDLHPKEPANQRPAQSQPPKEPGLFQRVAETAAGVAVGSAVGNLVTSGISSLFSGSNPDSKDTPRSSSDNSERVCERERLNFVHCTEKETDLAKCEDLQKEYKECRVKYNLPHCERHSTR